MKHLSEYLVALALAFSALALASVDVQAATVCGPNGCRHVYTHRGQWPVGGAQPTHYHNYYKYRYPHRSRWPVGGA
jgi:hypothetical protein